jgi:hypothetical protein
MDIARLIIFGIVIIAIWVITGFLVYTGVTPDILWGTFFSTIVLVVGYCYDSEYHGGS